MLSRPYGGRSACRAIGAPLFSLPERERWAPLRRPERVSFQRAFVRARFKDAFFSPAKLGIYPEAEFLITPRPASMRYGKNRYRGPRYDREQRQNLFSLPEK